MLLLIWLWWLPGFFAAAFALLVFAAPAWWLLHRSGREHWGYALALGFVVTCCYVIAAQILLQEAAGADIESPLNLSGPLYEKGSWTPEGWSLLLQSGLFAAPGGSLVGLIMWRIAYRAPQSAAA